MKKTVKIGSAVLGEGMPKICVPIVGNTQGEIREAISELLPHRPDLAEWRMDYYEGAECPEKLLEVLRAIREMVGRLPLLCTFRTRSEGGEAEVSAEEYETINHAVIDSGLADAVDVELFQEETVVRELLRHAHEKGVVVIGSSHDFQKTPPREEILGRLCRMRELGMDIAKIAAMPQGKADVLTLLDATLEMREHHPDTPVITMSMGREGLVSRLTGEIFGSVLTFGTVGRASAPGQIPVEDLRRVLEILHRNS